MKVPFATVQKCSFCNHQSRLVRSCLVCAQPVCSMHSFPDRKLKGPICQSCKYPDRLDSQPSPLPPLPEIEFSTNWNNKLVCQCFTTIRPWNPGKYRVGEKYRIKCTARTNAVEPFDAVLEVGKKFNLKDLPEITAALDTGYSKDETISIMNKMYPDSQAMDFGLYLFKRVLKGS